MAKGGFVVNWQGGQRCCHKVEIDFDENGLHFDNDDSWTEAGNWSMFSVHAILWPEPESKTNP